MNRFKRFFDPEPRFSLHLVAYLLVFGLLQLLGWALLLAGFYFGLQLFGRLTALIYASPQNYLLYSILPMFGLWLVYVVGLWGYFLLEFLLDLRQRRREHRG